MPTAPPPSPEIAIHSLLDPLPGGLRVLDLGSGTGTFPHDDYPELRTVAVDLVRVPALAGHFAVASAACLPFPDSTFDVVLAHWLFEHVDDLSATLDEVERVLRPGGLLAVAIPNSLSFEDRAYRFVSHVYKYALFHFKKRIEHVQVLTFLSLNEALYRRGFKLLRFRVGDAGYCWLEIPQLRKWRDPLLSMLRGLRGIGIDLFRGANYRMVYRLGVTDEIGGIYLSSRWIRSSKVGTSPG